jgi:uncharacterized delta-60 repeat protein
VKEFQTERFRHHDSIPMRTQITLSCLMVCMWMGGALPSYARPDSPDSSFNGNGVASVFFPVSFIRTGVAVDSAGRVVVVGTATDSRVTTGTDVLVLRFQANGVADPSFGEGGFRFVDLGNARLNDRAAAVAIDSSDRIVVTGDVDFGPEKDIVVFRLTTAGVVDATFTSTNSPPGFYRFDTEISSTSYNDEATCMAIDSSGRILVGGFSNTPSQGNNVRILRLTSAGLLDTSFGTDGLYRGVGGSENTINGTDGRVTGIAIRSSGEILFSCTVGSWATVLGMGANGGFEFGWPGSNVPNYIQNAVITGIRADANGQAIVCGYRPTGATKMFLARYANFGGSIEWVRDHDFGATTEQALGLALQSDGKIVIGGFSSGGPGILVARFNPDGTLDSGFDAFTENVTATANEGGTSVTLMPNGKIVLGGHAQGRLFAYVLAGDSAQSFYEDANFYHGYFTGLGRNREALAYWFYFRALGDLTHRTFRGETALANKEYYQGLAFFYYTFLEGQYGRLYLYYLYLGYSEYTSRLASGDAAGASLYYSYYLGLANSFL